jgi:hypothetical protein
MVGSIAAEEMETAASAARAIRSGFVMGPKVSTEFRQKSVFPV